MPVEIHGVYGEQDLARGSLAAPGLNNKGALVTQSAFASAVERGRVFSVCNQVGITSQAGLSATTPALTLANPAGSGVTGRLWFASANMLVANTAAATVWLAAGTDTVAATVTGTLTTAHRNLKLGGITPSTQGNRIVALLAATLPAAPVGVDILGVGLTAAITTSMQIPSHERCYYGAMLIQPGTNLSIQTSTASGANGLWCSYIWEECDLV